ncbi:putative RNA-directed DNA polymerase [Tanacetum coccineum]|uniref:RNA-directed DNA polymerase n=1 Tax=Tanacetum coccineum TaxID=301880 RepID=A0ABQ5J4N1_9ASTR
MTGGQNQTKPVSFHTTVNNNGEGSIRKQTQNQSNPIPGLSDEQYKQFINMFTYNEITQRMANMGARLDDDGNWIVDSGCTEHITHILNLFHGSIKATRELPVTIPNGDSIPVKGKGSCTLPNGTEIRDVLYVPEFTCNLLSVSRLTRDLRCSVTFFPDFFKMQDLNSRKLIGTGKCQRGLYRMNLVGQERKAMSASMEVWHKRLGHASSGKLFRFNFVKDASFKTVDCDSCAKAKHTRLPFPTSSIKSKECFELLHCDLWGRRSVWVFLLKQKFDAGDHLMFFHKMVKTQFGKSIKRIRCDNGGEFVSNRIHNFFAEEGIILETTCPHTTQQNGVVERKHRHLLDTARALRFEANLPKRFWGECVMTAAYVINRLPSKTIENKTPFEILYGEKPDYEHMKIFGCLAYFRNTDTRGDKFEWRGKPGVFLGYSPGTKGYKIYDITDNKTVVSRDVKFVEKVFPFKSMDRINREENKKLFDFPPWYYGEMDQEALGQNINTGETYETNEERQDVDDTTQVENTNETNDDGPTTFDEARVQRDNQTVNDQVEADTELNHRDENQMEEETTHLEQQPIRQQRVRTQPKRLGDFVVDLPPFIDHTQPTYDQESSTVHPLSHYVSYEHFSNTHKAFLCAINDHDEPKFFHQAAQNENWKEAMRKQIHVLSKMGHGPLNNYRRERKPSTQNGCTRSSSNQMVRWKGIK